MKKAVRTTPPTPTDEPQPTVALPAVGTSEAGGNPEDSVALRAFRRFEERGGEHGHDLEDWLEAERELRFAK